MKKQKIWFFLILFNAIFFSLPSYGQDVKSDKDPKAAEESLSPNDNNAADEQFEKLLDAELDPQTAKKEKTANQGMSWAFQILKTIFGLGIIIFFIYLIKKYMIFKNSFGAVDTGIIKMLHEYPVGTGKKMQLLEIGNKILLVGVSDAGLQLITEFREKASIDQIKLSIDNFGHNEPKDMWIEAGKAIKNKILDLLQGKKPSSGPDNGDWTNLQNKARQKINELRDKKKVFEDDEKFNDTLF